MQISEEFLPQRVTQLDEPSIPQVVNPFQKTSYVRKHHGALHEGLVSGLAVALAPTEAPERGLQPVSFA